MRDASELSFNNFKASYRKLGTGTRKILFFHGFPGSSAQIDFFEKYVKDLDLEVICVDRPGYNHSQTKSGDHALLTTQMNDYVVSSFGWETFELLSVSGGTPYLFSFIQTHPKKITRVTIVSGLMPVNQTEFKGILEPKLMYALRILPLIPNLILKLALPVNAEKRSAKRSPVLAYLMPVSKADERLMTDVKITDVLRKSFSEAFAQGGVGPKKDAKHYSSSWSTDLGEFKGPVTIWHGEEDRILPLAMAKQLATQIPAAKFHLIPNEGHYSLSVNEFANILG